YEKIWPVLHHAEYGPARRRADARGTPRQSGKSLQRPGGKRYYDALVVYLYRTDNSGARKSGKIVPFGCMRGQGNGTNPFFLRAGLVGTPVVVPHLIRRSVALRPSCHGSTDLQARQGDPEALQRTQAVSWLNPKAPL